MNIINDYLKSLEKFEFLKDVKYSGSSTSSFLLFRDHESNISQWKKKLNTDSPGHIKYLAYHNLLTDLSPTWISEIPSREIAAEKFNEMGVTIGQISFGLYSGYFLYLYSIWEFFKHRLDIPDNLNHPYKSVFTLVSRGGYISHHHGFLEINSITYPSFQNYITLPSVDPDFLDFIDSKRINSGPRSMPTQQELNELWEDFNVQS